MQGSLQVVIIVTITKQKCCYFESNFWLGSLLSLQQKIIKIIIRINYVF